MEKCYNLTETAEILGVKVRTLRAWIKDGTLFAFKYEGKRKWYISEGQIERLQEKMAKN